jgi:hypothetical protein
MTAALLLPSSAEGWALVIGACFFLVTVAVPLIGYRLTTGAKERYPAHPVDRAPDWQWPPRWYPKRREYVAFREMRNERAR